MNAPSCVFIIQGSLDASRPSPGPGPKRRYYYTGQNLDRYMGASGTEGLLGDYHPGHASLSAFDLDLDLSLSVCFAFDG